MNTAGKLMILLSGVIIFSMIALSVSSSKQTEYVYNQKVLKLQQQTIMTGGKDNISTEIRYLVITDKETFIVETSLLNGKYNNSDIFWRLKEGSVYNFRVCGYGKGALTDYRNILEYTERTN